jgi:hypothetical protein
LVYLFRGVSPWSLSSIAFGSRNDKAEHHGSKQVVNQSDSPHGREETERVREKEAKVKMCPSKARPQ